MYSVHNHIDCGNSETRRFETHGVSTKAPAADGGGDLSGGEEPAGPADHAQAAPRADQRAGRPAVTTRRPGRGAAAAAAAREGLEEFAGPAVAAAAAGPAAAGR